MLYFFAVIDVPLMVMYNNRWDNNQSETNGRQLEHLSIGYHTAFYNEQNPYHKVSYKMPQDDKMCCINNIIYAKTNKRKANMTENNQRQQAIADFWWVKRQ